MNLTERELKKRASEASNAYIDNKIAPNDSITKIASRDELNDHQVARICEMANHDIRSQLYKDASVDQSRVVFPAADSVKVINSISKPESTMETQKQASVNINVSSIVPSDYFSSPGEVISRARYNEPITMGMQKQAFINTEFMKKDLEYIGSEFNKLATETRRDLLKFASLRNDFFEQAASDLRFGGMTAYSMVKMAASTGVEHGLEFLKDNIDLMKEAMPTDNLKGVVESMSEYINPDIKANYIIGDAPLLIKYKGVVTASNNIRRKVYIYKRHKFIYVHNSKSWVFFYILYPFS